MGTSAWRSRSLQKTLLAFEFGGGAAGPNARSPASSKASTMPAARGPPGPTTVSPTSFSLAKRIRAGKSVGWMAMFSPSDIGAGVAGGHEDAVGAGALRDLPCQGVFPPPLPTTKIFMLSTPPNRKRKQTIVVRNARRVRGTPASWWWSGAGCAGIRGRGGRGTQV